MKRHLPSFASLLTITLATCMTTTRADDLVLVQGAGGSPEYMAQFSDWTERWKTIGHQMAAQIHTIEPTDDKTQRDALAQQLATLPTSSESPVWLVLIGHGTYFQGEAKFNLVGPDVTSRELNQWLARFERPVAIINCASCSGAFLNTLSGPNRIVVTATKSGQEQNFARFGQYLARAVVDPAADLDHDQSITLLEAFLAASHRTEAFYRDHARLATEHALLDDNGDRQGTPASFFTGIYADPSPATSQGDDVRETEVDGRIAHQWTLIQLTDTPALSRQDQVRRDAIEREIQQLRDTKADMDDDTYYEKLEVLVLEIARLYAR